MTQKTKKKPRARRRDELRYESLSSSRAATTGSGNKDPIFFFNPLNDAVGCDCAAAGCAIGGGRHNHWQRDRRRRRATGTAGYEIANGGARRGRARTVRQRRVRDRRNATSDRNRTSRGAARDEMAEARIQSASRIHATTKMAEAALSWTETPSTAAARTQSTAAAFPSRPVASFLRVEKEQGFNSQSVAKKTDGVRAQTRSD
jgi:hypothetical protein